MTIEATLERIATALEQIAGNGGIATAAPAADKKPASTNAGKKPAASTSASKGKGKSAKEKPAAGEKDAGPKLEDVRAALQKVQKATDGKTAKGLLSDFGATVLSKLDEGKYAELISKAGEIVAEAEEHGEDE